MSLMIQPTNFYLATESFEMDSYLSQIRDIVIFYHNMLRCVAQSNARPRAGLPQNRPVKRNWGMPTERGNLFCGMALFIISTVYVI